MIVFAGGLVRTMDRADRPRRPLRAAGFTDIALGSDAPVEEMDPLQGLRDAVLREWRAHEALDLAPALEALTVTPGMLADLVILDRDPFDDLTGARIVTCMTGWRRAGA